MIWKHFEHLAQPGTAQCSVWNLHSPVQRVRAACASWDSPVCLPSLYKCTGMTLLMLLCLTAYVLWRFRIRSSGLCSQHFHPLCDLPSPQQLFWHKPITYALTSFSLEPFSSISTNIEGSGSTTWLTCSNYFLFCSDHLNKSCLKQSCF